MPPKAALAMAEPVIFDARDPTLGNLRAIKAYIEKNGVIVLKIWGKRQCRATVTEMWRKVISKQHWTDEYQIVIRSRKDNCILVVHSEADEKEFYRTVTGVLSPQERNMFERGWPLHRGFGACCDPAVFHMDTVTSIWQDPNLYRCASIIMDDHKLWSQVNRGVQVLPAQGENEVLHFDNNALSKKSEPVTGLAGKFCASDSRFVYVPRIHTDEWLEDFQEQYAPLYPNVKPNASKMELKAELSDPMHLLERKEVMRVPRGCIVYWFKKTLHGQIKVCIDKPIQYGCYAGMGIAGSRAAYKKKCGVDELEDRIGSYLQGRAPMLWPSLDKVQFYPKKFDNFPHLMQAYIKKLPPNHPMIATRISPKGKTVEFLTPMSNIGYVPPPFTSLGKRLLGLEEWEDELDDAEAGAPGPAAKRVRV